MNDSQRNTNEAVENKRKKDFVIDLQSKNWYVNMKEFMHPLLEVIDENTVMIEGVEYRKVETEKPQTLERIITECMIGYNNTVIVELMERILDRVEVEILPKKFQSYREYSEGWNDCVEVLRTRVRE